MSKERKRTEEQEVELNRKLDEKVEKKLAKDKRKAEKRANSKFRNSKFGKKWFALKKWQRVVVYVLIALILLALIAFATVYGIYNGFRTDINEENLGISTEIEEKYGETDIFNVALFGVDTRDEDSFSGRSDSIIIVSIDKNNNIVKLTSILRDSYVAIEGHKNQKITHAYKFGGAELAIKTINQNFGMNITDYATINFFKLAEAIDILGGVDIEVSEVERKHLNDIGDDENPDFNYLDEAGLVHLTGEQAVVYARLRYIDSDVERSNRQRKVIEALIVQAKKVSPTKYAETVRTMMSLCETSLSFSEIMSFAPMITKDITIQTLTIPGDEENAIGGMYEGAWVWRYDLSQATQHIHEFIYGEPLDTVPDSVISANDSDSDSKSDSDDDEKSSSSGNNKTNNTGNNNNSSSNTGNNTGNSNGNNTGNNSGNNTGSGTGNTGGNNNNKPDTGDNNTEDATEDPTNDGSSVTDEDSTDSTDSQVPATSDPAETTSGNAAA